MLFYANIIFNPIVHGVSMVTFVPKIPTTTAIDLSGKKYLRFANFAATSSNIFIYFLSELVILTTQHIITIAITTVVYITTKRR